MGHDTGKTRRKKGDVHVIPINDLREHDESEDCWCEPRIEGEAPPFLIVHHSADKRELTEGRT